MEEHDYNVALQRLEPCDDPDSGFTVADYRRVAHIMSLVILPVNLLGVYCIVCQSSRNMRSYMPHLLTYQFWVLLTDLNVGLLTTPVLYIRVSGGCTVGILQDLGLPVVLQTVLATVAFSGTGTSIFVLFAYRHQVILRPDHVLKIRSPYTRTALVVLHYVVICNVMTVSILTRPDDQRSVQIQAAIELNCIPPGFLTNSVLFVRSKDQVKVGAYLSAVFLTVGCSEVLFLALHSAWELFKRNDYESTNYRKLQKVYFIHLCAQMAIPATMLAFPFSYLLFATRYKIYNQQLNNAAALWSSLHGLVATLTLILINKKYRQFVFCTGPSSPVANMLNAARPTIS